MRNNSLQSRQVYNDQFADISSDRVALISKKRLIVEEDVEAGGSGDDAALDAINQASAANVPPPPWIDDLLDIRYNCSIIAQKMKELDNLQNKHLQRPTFDDDTSTELQIEELTQNITRLFGTCHRLVQQMQGKGLRSSWNEKRLRDNVIRSTVTTLQDMSSKFRTSQGQYLRRITAREEMSNQYLNFDDMMTESSPYNYDDMFLESESGGNKNPQWTQQQLLALEEDNVVLQEREREVQQIVKSILDLNTVFRELAHMVQEQSGVVDRIDYHVENTHIKVEEGVRQLQKASNYQKRNRKCVCVAATVAVTFVLIILLVAFGT
jgi:syntaxin 16